MSRSRNWDRSPETPADKRFHDLRASGYRGPIDHHGRKATDPDGVLAALARATDRAIRDTNRKDSRRG